VLVVCLGFVVVTLVVLHAAKTGDGAAPTNVTGSTTVTTATTTPASSGARPATSTTSHRASTTTERRPTTSTADVGALPQTDVQPTTQSAAFKSHAADLWRAVATDDPDAALGTFFPLGAYRQVKDIADPDADWTNRLVANFRTDVHALHAQLGADASSATFERLDVPDGAAQWIQPGVEYNKGAYWRVYGSRLLYTVGGVERSLPVTSLISWRGEWYVVHLGAIR
jgi:hypothetical protein